MENAINAPPVLNYVSLTNELGMAGGSVGTPVFRNSLNSAETVTMASALSRNCQCPATNCWSLLLCSPTSPSTPGPPCYAGGCGHFCIGGLPDLLYALRPHLQVFKLLLKSADAWCRSHAQLSVNSSIGFTVSPILASVRMFSPICSFVSFSKDKALSLGGWGGRSLLLPGTGEGCGKRNLGH